MAKSKKELDNEYYQKNKERKRAQRRARYQQEKELVEREKKELEHLLYQAEAIKVLMSLKDYTETSPEKKKLWANLVWTLQDLAKNINLADIVWIQKLELATVNLIRDYYQTAKGESKGLERHWNSLSNEEQGKLIKHWGLEKARREKALIDKLKKFEAQGEYFEKDIELAKFHEELGKVKCECWKCQEEKKIRTELKSERTPKEVKEKLACGECQKMVFYSSWNEEAGACKSCVKLINS